MKNKHGGKKYFYKLGYADGLNGRYSINHYNLPCWAADAYDLGLWDGINNKDLSK